MNHNLNKRYLQEEEVKDFSFSHIKGPRLENLNEEPADARSFLPLNNPCPQELYDPEEDLEDQFNSEGIPDCQKRLYYLRELNTILYNFCRNEIYHKLRALKEGFLNEFENLIARYFDQFEELGVEFGIIHWN